MIHIQLLRHFFVNLDNREVNFTSKNESHTFPPPAELLKYKTRLVYPYNFQTQTSIYDHCGAFFYRL